MHKIDVIIPTYKPDQSFFELIDKLCRQTMEVHEIIVMNTEEKYFDKLMYESRIALKFKDKVKVCHLSKLEFDHGGTRHKGVQKSEADVVVMMTQDAMPADEYLIENLVKALEDEKIAAAYARQLPAKDCSELEQIVRNFNYPPQSHVRTREDIPEKGIKTFFCSNVCAAYKRKVYNELGGFIRRTIFNEDMIYAAGAVKAGYGIAYAADAQVYHSHNYTNMQQFHRNFDLGVSQADHPGIFAKVPSVSEGKKLVKTVTGELRQNKKYKTLFGFYVQCAFKYAGYFLGKHYQRLPRKLVLKCSMSPSYWKKV